MNSGHGWTHDTDFTPPWRLQRGVGNLMNEDYGNLDQLNFFATDCFNAGATVVSLRPLGHQTNEVVLDNDDAGVTFAGSWSDTCRFVRQSRRRGLSFAPLAGTGRRRTYTPTIPLAAITRCTGRGMGRTAAIALSHRHRAGNADSHPHHMVGNGWVYLGIPFNAGANAAVGSWSSATCAARRPAAW
jgi:hypothetical protein